MNKYGCVCMAELYICVQGKSKMMVIEQEEDEENQKNHTHLMWKNTKNSLFITLHRVYWHKYNMLSLRQYQRAFFSYRISPSAKHKEQQKQQ